MARPNRREELADAILDAKERVAEATADGLERDPTMRRLPFERERRLFWERALSPEDEAILWAQGADPWEISSKVFPRRWQLMTLGRPDEKDQRAWLRKHTELGPPSEDAADDDDAAAYAEGEAI